MVLYGLQRIIRRLACLSALCFAASCASPDWASIQDIASGPIYPDYRDVTVPAGIAPLNFCYTSNVAAKAVTTFSAGNLQFRFRGPAVEWKECRWRRLVAAATDGEISVNSTVAGNWKIFVSPDEMDYGITYRLVKPGYERYGRMGLYERSLSDFSEKPLIVNNEFEGCINCHEVNKADPDYSSVHVRGAHGATLIGAGGPLEAFDTKTDSTLASCVYPYWHPSGRYIAYSTNVTKQAFHVAPPKDIEVYDLKSDLQVYDTQTATLISAPSIKDSEWFESFPAFSPDGNTLYFTRAQARNIPEKVTDMHYSLCAVSFNPRTGSIGSDVRTLFEGPFSIATPRPSYDGRFLMFTVSDYGTFPIWHHEADLWLLDLATGEARSLDDANSQDTESWHNWSSNSRWFLFSSRRDDGRFTRLYLAHMAEDGTVGKPFMLPQKHPYEYYRDLMFSYNVPTFVSKPSPFGGRAVDRAILSPERRKMGFRWSDR